LGLIEDAKANECLALLSGQIEAGEWPDWRKDFDEMEGGLGVADIEQGRARVG
jgi:hypothetical protein